VDSLSALLESVVAGRGVALTTPSIARALGGRGVAYVLVEDLEPSVAALVWRKGAANPALPLLIQTARDVRLAMLAGNATAEGPMIAVPCRPLAAWWEHCSPRPDAQSEGCRAGDQAG